MAFKDNFRIEKIYFQRVKDDAQILASWKTDARRYSDEEISRIAKDACDSILMLYRLIGEAWNDALNHIEKLSAELEALASKAEAYHDELNEKIDEVNNYLNTQIKNLEIRVENIENSIEDFGGLPSNENANENDVLTVGPNHVNIWKRVSGLEILTLEYDATNEEYVLKDPTGSVITTNAIALSWFNKGAIIKVLSTDVDTAFRLNYNSFYEPLPESGSLDVVNPFLNMFLYPAFLRSGRPIWSGYGAEVYNTIGVIPRVDFYFSPNNASEIFSYDNVADSIALTMDEVADSGGYYNVTGKGGNLFNVLKSLSNPLYSINLEIKKRTIRQDNYCTFEVVPYTKYDYLPAVQVAALIDPQAPQPISNSNGILIYLENGDKIVGYTSRGNGTHTLLMDFYVYIKNELNVIFHIKNLNDNTTRTLSYSKLLSVTDDDFIFDTHSENVEIPANSEATFTAHLPITNELQGQTFAGFQSNNVSVDKNEEYSQEGYFRIFDGAQVIIYLNNYQGQEIYLEIIPQQ